MRNYQRNHTPMWFSTLIGHTTCIFNKLLSHWFPPFPLGNSNHNLSLPQKRNMRGRRWGNVASSTKTFQGCWEIWFYRTLLRGAIEFHYVTHTRTRTHTHTHTHTHTYTHTYTHNCPSLFIYFPSNLSRKLGTINPVQQPLLIRA